MANNFSRPSVPPYPPPPYQLAGPSGYLLGLAPTPPPRPEHVAAAVANHLLNNPQGAPAGPNLDLEDEQEDEDVFIDPQLRGVAPPVTQIAVRIPINDKVTRDITFSSNVAREDFLDRIIATLGLDRNTAQLGWKTSDEGKRAPAHQLNTVDDANTAIKTIIDIKNNPRRRKDIVLEIVHLNPAPVQPPAPKKKQDGNRATDFAYSEELRIVQEKLRCALHGGPNRWCYVSPTDPDTHVALGLEEISLWARKIHDNEADIDCITPPNCLAMDKMHQRKASLRRESTKPAAPPIHVHINNAAPLGDTTKHNVPGSLKRTRSASGDVSSDDEDNAAASLLLADVLQELHRKYPLLDLPQYMPILEAQRIVYAKTVLDFDKGYFVGLGFAEGAVGIFLRGVRKAYVRCKAGPKRARVDDEGNL